MGGIPPKLYKDVHLFHRLNVNCLERLRVFLEKTRFGEKNRAIK